MGTLNQALGMNLTEYDPLIDSPYNGGSNNGSSPIPPGNYFLELVSPLAPFLLLSGQFQTLL